jgi:DNA-binding HxlR family transcriptional regulator
MEAGYVWEAGSHTCPSIVEHPAHQAQERTFTSPSYLEITVQRSTAVERTQMSCRGREILDRVADKWSLHVIAQLSEGTKRFMELRREVDGISQRVLTVTLRSLERDGLVTRTVYPVVPPRVEYDLTEFGTGLLPAVMPLILWAEANLDKIDSSRATYDAARDS